MSGTIRSCPDFGDAVCPRQTLSRTTSCPPARSTSRHLSPRISPARSPAWAASRKASRWLAVATARMRGDILVGERVRDLRARLRHGRASGRAFEIARLDGEAAQYGPEHDVHLAPRLRLRPTLDALRIELPHHFRIDLVEAKVPDPRQEEPSSNRLYPWIVDGLSRVGAKVRRYSAATSVKTGRAFGFGGRSSFGLSPPPVGDPVETRRASRRRSSARAAASICTSASRRNRPCDPSGFV